mmetsp:Transcript_80359/g.260343  ORF Transcript_80359/g.260343 Transcript_80359/m.260343 type:complete len:273 (-) Transcript_80359:344-1162(-)
MPAPQLHPSPHRPLAAPGGRSSQLFGQRARRPCHRPHGARAGRARHTCRDRRRFCRRPGGCWRWRLQAPLLRPAQLPATRRQGPGAAPAFGGRPPVRATRASVALAGSAAAQPPCPTTAPPPLPRQCHPKCLVVPGGLPARRAPPALKLPPLGSNQAARRVRRPAPLKTPQDQLGPARQLQIATQRCRPPSASLAQSRPPCGRFRSRHSRRAPGSLASMAQHTCPRSPAAYKRPCGRSTSCRRAASLRGSPTLGAAQVPPRSGLALVALPLA